MVDAVDAALDVLRLAADCAPERRRALPDVLLRLEELGAALREDGFLAVLREEGFAALRAEDFAALPEAFFAVPRAAGFALEAARRPDVEPFAEDDEREALPEPEAALAREPPLGFLAALDRDPDEARLGALPLAPDPAERFVALDFGCGIRSLPSGAADAGEGTGKPALDTAGKESRRARGKQPPTW